MPKSKRKSSAPSSWQTKSLPSLVYTQRAQTRPVEDFCAGAAKTCSRGRTGWGGKRIGGMGAMGEQQKELKCIFIFLDFAHKMRISLYAHKHLERWTLQRGPAQNMAYFLGQLQPGLPSWLWYPYAPPLQGRPVWGCKNLLPFACVDACLHTCNNISVFIARKTISNWAGTSGHYL